MKTTYEPKWIESKEKYQNIVQISECGKYRWYFSSKTGFVGPVKRMIFMMINPSTASHEVDDATVRSCRRIAAANECTDFVILNFFPFRTPKVKDLLDWFLTTNMQEHFDVTTVNLQLVKGALGAAKENPSENIFVVACGRFNKASDLKEQFDIFIKMATGAPLYCLGHNSDGSPMHPLFKSAKTKLVTF